MRNRVIATVTVLLSLVCPTHGVTDTSVIIDPSSPAAAASRIHAIDLTRLGGDLSRAGLEMPTRLEVALIPESDSRAREVPPWIVGLALEPAGIVIFHDRVLPYPYDSLESVFRHEVAHLALSARAGYQPLPRWFHEGVAMSVDRGWGARGQLRLLLEMTGDPAIADVTRLFAAGAAPEAARAYGLAAALVADIQQRHGWNAPGRIAGRVALGIPFSRAFQLETGDTPDRAAERAWRGYRHWTMWVSAMTSETAIWGVIVTLAIVASVVQVRRRARRRAKWDELEPTDPRLDP